jgi:dTDP-4-amino-4,6-dideoxygalactose transaminase/very-short-patch-repair endonuclease
MNKDIITVTSPLMPDLEEFHELLKDIWDRRWITNNGHYHQLLEKALAEYLKVPYVSLFTNGTLPLITALQALRITGEVITTPYSFVATTHALWWNGIKPVFVDIEWATGCMDPNKIEAAITPKTTAIMPVHVYGKPCNIKAIQDIADKYGLKVIYDAAHAFGVESLTPIPSPVERGEREGNFRMTANPADYAYLIEHAREMRKESTQAEDVLWQALRNSQLGSKWRRQHPVLDFIVDFINFNHSIVIEVDGGYHTSPEQRKADATRDKILCDNGFYVMRFTNEQVLHDTDNTILRIKNTMNNFPLQGGQRGAWTSILNAGDMSTLSFHATKVYNTIEGGAMVMHDEKTKQRIDYLKNFGFAGETEVVAPGINSKMDEMRSAYGLLNLRQVDAAIEARHQVAIKYREALRHVEGITFWDDLPGVRHNYSYFPIFVDAKKYGMTRDELYFKMKEQGIWGRRYFYPLISDFTTYRGLPSATKENLPVATKMAEEVICLPMHHALSDEDIERVINCILK